MAVIPKNALGFLLLVAGVTLLSTPSVLSQEESDADNDVNIDGDPFDLFEGDIIGYKPTEGALYSGVTNKDNLWPGKWVPYEISPVYSAKDRQTIENAVRDLSAKTCLRFRPRKADDQYSIYIHHQKSGCFAFWGRQSHATLRRINRSNPRLGTKQLVNIAAGGCVSHATVQHELMHTVGFLHEQARYDRDNYVDIVWSNIQAGKDDQFQKQADSDPQGTPYDFGSVMHYSKGAFSRGRGLDTIKPKAKYAGKTLGNENGVTATDIQKINRLYGCEKVPRAPETSSGSGDTSGSGSGDGGSQQYTVKEGDTLMKIAQDLGKSWQKIAKDNNIQNPDFIRVGQVLTIY